MIRYALKGTALVAIFGLAATSRLLDAVRLEIEYRLNGEEPRHVTPAPNPSALDELGGRHDGGAAGRWGA